MQRDFNRGQDSFRLFSEIEKHLETSRNGTNEGEIMSQNSLVEIATTQNFVFKKLLLDVMMLPF